MSKLNKLIAGLDGTASFDSDVAEIKPKGVKGLSSTQFLKLIDVICEGEIEGFPTPINAGIDRDTLNYKIAALSDIFLGKTPIMKASPDVNKSQTIEQIIADQKALTDLSEKKAAESELNNVVPENFNFKDIVASLRFGQADKDDNGVKISQFNANWKTDDTSTITITNTDTGTVAPQITKGDQVQVFFTKTSGTPSEITVSEVSATYDQAGIDENQENIITITKSGHGLSAGKFLFFNFTSGSAVDGIYQIKSTTTNSFDISVGGDNNPTNGNVTYSTSNKDKFYKVKTSDHINQFTITNFGEGDNGAIEQTLAASNNTDNKCFVFKQPNKPFKGFVAVEQPLNFSNYNTTVTKNNPQNFQIEKSPLTKEQFAANPNSPGFDALKVVLTWQSHFKGNQKKTKTSYRIRITDVNGVDYDFIPDDDIYNTALDNKKPGKPSTIILKGKTTKPYSRSHIINFGELEQVGDGEPNSEPVFPITLKVQRLDTLKASTTAKFVVSGISKVFNSKNKYEDLAAVALRVDSASFGNVPSRMYRIRGTRVRIPKTDSAGLTPTVINNQAEADALGLGTISSFGFIHYPTGYNFTGELTNKAVWTSDPSWILLDIMLSKRYGLGDHIELSQVDLYSLYAISKYSSALVEVKNTEILSADPNAPEQITPVVIAKEPRFSCNVVFRTREDSFKVINELTSIFRGLAYWAEGKLEFSQDSPTQDPSYLFNLANVTEGGFTYSGTSVKSRANVVSVSYFENKTQEKAFVTVVDNNSAYGSGLETANKFGESVHKKIEAFGCTSKHQARRLANIILFEENRSTETISFSTGLAGGVTVRPGMIIEVTDPVKSGLRRGGRIKSVTSSTVFDVDDSANTSLPSTSTSAKIKVVIPSPPSTTTYTGDGTAGPFAIGFSYSFQSDITVKVNDVVKTLTTHYTFTSSTEITFTSGNEPAVGTTIEIISSNTLNVEERTITQVSGTTITVSSGFSTDPVVNAEYLITDDNVKPTQWRVISVVEDKDVYQITGISYHSTKYDFIENVTDAVPVEENITILNKTLPSPQGLGVEELQYVQDGYLRNKLVISWQPVDGAKNYRVVYSSADDNPISVETELTTLEILNAQITSSSGEVEDGVLNESLGYDIEVFTVNVSGSEPSASSKLDNVQVLGKITPPDDLSGLTVEPVDKNFVRLTWNKSEDVSVINGGRIYIKHTNLTSGATFQNSSPIIEAVSGTSTEAVVPKLAGTYVVKARDANDNFSNGEQTVQFALDDSEADDQDTITNINEDGASFAGTKTGVAITADGTGLEMILAGDGLFDDETDFDTLTPNLDQIGDTISTTGTYEFTTVGDLGANNKMPTHFIKEIAATTFLKNTEIDTRNNIDLFSDIDGTKIDEPKVDLFVATTDDDPSSGSPTFTAFEKFSNATFKGRGYKFKAVFTSNKPDENIKVTTLRATGSLAQRTETQREGTCVHTVNGDFVSSASAGTITVTPTTSGISGTIVGTDILNGDTVNLTFTTNTFTGTYVATGGTTNIDITILNHGINVGSSVILDFTSGSAADGTYTVTGTTTHRIIVTSATSLDTSGNVTVTIPKPDDGTYTVASVSGTTSFTVNDADAPTADASNLQCVTKKTMSSNEGVTTGGTDAGLVRSGAFGVTCTFSKRFKTPPTVNVFQSGATSLFYQPVAITETEFTVRFANAANELVSTLFSYQATGFGKGDTS